MLVGIGVSIWLFANQTKYIGVVPKHHPAFGDITFEVGFVIAAVLYCVLFLALEADRGRRRRAGSRRVAGVTAVDPTADGSRSRSRRPGSGSAEGGIPIGGALIGADGTVLGRGHNRRVQDDDPSMHGETAAFRNAGRQPSYRGTTMVTTLSPCWYCSGLVRQFGITPGRHRRGAHVLRRPRLAGRERRRGRAARRPGVRADDDRLHRRLPRAVERGHRRRLTPASTARIGRKLSPGEKNLPIPAGRIGDSQLVASRYSGWRPKVEVVPSDVSTRKNRSSGKPGPKQDRTDAQRRAGSAAQERLAARRAADAARRASQARRKRILTIVAPIVAVAVLVGGFVAVKAATGAGSPKSGQAATVAAAAVITDVTSVPSATLDAVGAGTATSVPKSVDATALTAGGKPEILYVGAEYCPYCAAERWAMVVALSRFGTFTEPRQTASSTSDVYPSTHDLLRSTARRSPAHIG